MANPFLDSKNLTDEQILEKIGKANSYFYEQHKLGHTQTIDSIKSVLQTLQDEKNDRIEKLATEEHKSKNPKDLEPITLGDLDLTPIPIFIDEDERKRAKRGRNRRL